MLAKNFVGIGHQCYCKSNTPFCGWGTSREQKASKRLQLYFSSTKFTETQTIMKE